MAHLHRPSAMPRIVGHARPTRLLSHLTMNSRNLLLAALTCLIATPTLAVNKCVDANGRVSYQNGPCPAHARGGEINLNVNRSFAGQSVTTPMPINIDPERPPRQPAQNVELTAKPRADGS